MLLRCESLEPPMSQSDHGQKGSNLVRLPLIATAVKTEMLDRQPHARERTRSRGSALRAKAGASFIGVDHWVSRVR